MRILDDSTLALSPSDLSAHLACPHLTTLSLRVVRGELERAPPRLAASRSHLPEGERARGRVPRPARDRRPVDHHDSDVRRRELRPDRGATAHRGGDPRSVRRGHLPAVPDGRRREVARVRRLPRAAAGRDVRAGRHEARADARSRRTSSSSASTRSRLRGSRARPWSTSTSRTGAASGRRSAWRSSRPTTAACATASSRRSSASRRPTAGRATTAGSATSGRSAGSSASTTTT